MLKVPEGDLNSMSVQYGAGSISGYIVRETVCFQEDKCVSDKSLLAVTRTEGLKVLQPDGLVGINPESRLLDEMRDAGLINNR